mgnify:CR=1 FL=1
MFRVVTSRIVQILALALLVAPSGDAFTGFPAWIKTIVTSEVAQGMMYRSRTLLQARSIMLESGSKIGYYLRGNSENPTTTPHAGIGFRPTLPRRLRGAGRVARSFRLMLTLKFTGTLPRCAGVQVPYVCHVAGGNFWRSLRCF